MSESLLIELSWPAKQLSPNARVHHMVKHRYAKAAKIAKLPDDRRLA